jgi:hypothetical protein
MFLGLVWGTVSRLYDPYIYTYHFFFFFLYSYLHAYTPHGSL